MGGGVILHTKCEIFLAVGQLIKSQKSRLWILHLCGFYLAEQKVLHRMVRTVAFWPVLGLRMVMVWFLSEKFLMIDWVRTLKGHPNKIS
jgi:hypothetical protein